MIRKFYSWFHRLISRPQERGEYSSGHWQDLIRKTALDFCREKKGRLLEIGCGEGLFIRQLAGVNPALMIWGVDNSRERLDRAGLKAREEGVVSLNLSYQQAPDLNFADGYFDLVVCINVFFNMNSPEMVKQTLSQMKRLSNDSGSVIFDFRNSRNPLLRIKYGLAKYYDPSVKDLPLKTYSPKVIKSILKELGLEVIKEKSLGFGFFGLAPIIIIEAKKHAD